MTCFWDGILAHLTPDETHIMGGGTPVGLQRYMRAANRAATSCEWQGRPLTRQQLSENRAWIRDDATPVGHGHDTSACDPYLCLLVHLLGADVVHDYAGTVLRYTYTGSFRRANNVRRVLRFRSNRGHFWAVT